MFYPCVFIISPAPSPPTNQILILTLNVSLLSLSQQTFYGAFAQHQKTGMWLCMSCTRLISLVMGNLLKVSRGERFKSWSEITFSLFFSTADRGTWSILPVDFTPHPITDPAAAASLLSLLCKAISGGEPITSSQLSPALFCRAQRVLYTVTDARNTGAAHVGKSRDLHFVCSPVQLDILVETQIKKRENHGSSLL